MNASCIKAIKTTYSTCRGSKTVCKKGMNEYLEFEKEAGAYEAVGRVVEERSVRKSRQAMAKLVHPSSTVGGSNRKKARREPEVKVPLSEASQSRLALQSLRKKRR